SGTVRSSSTRRPNWKISRAINRRCVFSTSPSKSSVPVSMTTTRIGEDSTPNAQRPTLNTQQLWIGLLASSAKRRVSGSVLILFLSNKRELFPFDHRATDRDFSDVFAARHIVHDVEHDALEHRSQRTRSRTLRHGLGCERF